MNSNINNLNVPSRSSFREYYADEDGPRKWKEDARIFCNILSSNKELDESVLEAFYFFIAGTNAAASFVSFWDRSTLEDSVVVAEELYNAYQKYTDATGINNNPLFGRLRSMIFEFKNPELR